MEFLILFKILVQEIVLLCILYDDDGDVINFNVQLYIIILLNYTKISSILRSLFSFLLCHTSSKPIDD